ncbi:WecB/TagA/CpsF family glycosyltransferase [Zooshikella ganghwensis]|uniref:WecB/TagA/CpsF family glycosyltransferase n=1 Tax=Zooshikella ganghwensis TaxID=202772 RepID=A0A4P9VNH6_9GAMM|nr:WecB/TagA/CpsF family glycosyltransferase [Zooshikella ganghwensis]RDH44963.1 WecB/TagA/CpsF family glycosyltransferase [Zooshikella ganghwensis]
MLTNQTTTSASSNKSLLLGIPFANINRHRALDIVTKTLDQRSSSNLFFINAHCLNTAYSNSEYKKALQKASIVLPDGSGVSYACKILGGHLTENLNGTDLFPYLCTLFSKKNKSIYLLGAKPGTVDQLEALIKLQFPALKVVGTQHGYFPPSETNKIIDQINHSGADVLLVALGVPKQEIWISQHQHKLSTTLNIAVGGLFDFYAKNVSRAPFWMRKLGIEWVWRLIQEPKRMWKRYILGSPLFIWRVWQAKKILNPPQHSHNSLSNAYEKLISLIRSKLLRNYWQLRNKLPLKMKRIIDILLSTFGLIVLLPLCLLIMTAIKIESSGPIFFKQTRAGFRGNPFLLWKFRSMHQDAEKQRIDLESSNEMQDAVTFKVKNDPRVTNVGRLIRKLSLDEIPQLWNVLKGEMSLVGPRPALYSEIEKYSLLQRQRLDTIPGLTSDWVIAGRSKISFKRQAELDIDYVHRQSLWRDIKLIFQTIPSLISGQGAY